MGPAGSGKSLTSLYLAKGLTRNGKVLAIDTERGSLDNYADAIPDFEFDKLELPSFSPGIYVEAIEYGLSKGYDTINVDSLSHAWSGKGGALEMVDNAAKRNQGNSYVSWREVTPEHNKLVDILLTAPAHMIVTMRSKMEYVLEKDESTGKTVPKKIGLAPIQRQDMEYELSLVAEMNMNHDLIVGKTRYRFLDNAVIHMPDHKLGAQIREWLDGNEPELPSKDALLVEVGGIMKRKVITLDKLIEAGYTNPREMDAEALVGLVDYLKGV